MSGPNETIDACTTGRMSTPLPLTLQLCLLLFVVISFAASTAAFQQHQQLPFLHRSHTIIQTTTDTVWNANDDARRLLLRPRSSNTKLQLFPEAAAQVVMEAAASSSSSGDTTATVTSTTTTIASLFSSNVLLTAVVSNSPEPIHTLFSVATFLPQPFWLLLILFPEQKFTRKIMGGLEVPVLCSLIHLSIVLASLGEQDATAPLLEFNKVFDPLGDPQKAFMGMVSTYPNFVAEEWSHVLAWDLFVGRWIWLDALEKGIAAAIPTRIGILFCNLIGPPGFLIYWLYSQVSLMMMRRGGGEQ